MRRTIMILALFLAISSYTMAEEWTSSGNYNISWYNNSSQEFIIYTNKELAGVAYLVNNGYTTFQGVTIKMGADISLSGKDWRTIALDDDHSFRGVFDGQDHTISGITINRNSGDKMYFSFWGNLKDATIKNVTMAGDANVTEPTSYYLKQYTGGLAAYAENSTIEHCHVIMDVAYKRVTTNSFPLDSNSSYDACVGGVIGKANKSKISHCVHEGNLSMTFGTRPGNGEYYRGSTYTPVGGLVGHSEYTSIEYCENYSDLIESEAKGSKNTIYYGMNLGGIAGRFSYGNMLCCSSRASIKGVFNGSNTIGIQMGGIAGYHTGNYHDASIINCYSSSVDFYAGAGNSSTTVNYGGITGKTNYVNTMTANYSASDLSINNTSLPKYKGEDGSTSFSADQMKSSTFLEELNIYSTLYLGKAVWGRDDGYPYIIT